MNDEQPQGTALVVIPETSHAGIESMRQTLEGVAPGQACIVPAFVLRWLVERADYTKRTIQVLYWYNAVGIASCALVHWLYGWQLAVSLAAGCVGAAGVAALLAIRSEAIRR